MYMVVVVVVCVCADESTRCTCTQLKVGVEPIRVMPTIEQLSVVIDEWRRIYRK